jgi:hypothetical protein
MIMEIKNFKKLVSEYFSALCENFRLTIEYFDDGEVALVGSKYLLLVWCDLDGVSIKYVMLHGNDMYSAIDLGCFLASKRKWQCADNLGTYEGFEKQVRQGLASYSLTLTSSATDILYGETKWLKDVVHRPIALSQPTVFKIKEVLKKKK